MLQELGDGLEGLDDNNPIKAPLDPNKKPDDPPADGEKKDDGKKDDDKEKKDEKVEA